MKHGLKFIHVTAGVSKNENRVIHIWQLSLADRDEVSVMREGLDILRSRSHAERRNTELAALPDLANCNLVKAFRWKAREQLGGWQERVLEPPFGGQRHQFIHRPCALYDEVPGRGAAQSRQMGSAAQFLS